MRVLMLGMCASVAAGVFATMVAMICSISGDAARPPAFRQRLAVELMWAAIPCLLIVAAAIPAVIASISVHAD